MNCRIERIVTSEGWTVLIVSGRLKGPHIDTLRCLLGQEHGVAAIDLKDVLLVDREAVKLLAISEAGGVELTSCPSYVREWVTRMRVCPGPSQAPGNSDGDDAV
jgi:hypothetical protein